MNLDFFRFVIFFTTDIERGIVLQNENKERKSLLSEVDY